MTPGNNGASTPEDDDPFGYLYADGQAAGATPPDGGGGYGYPGSVNRVRAVGERQYGQQAQQSQQASQTAPTAQYAQAPAQQGQGTYGQSHYQAPETFGGASTTRTPLPGSGMGGGGGRGRGPNTKGLLIGAIAVVAAVVIGIGVAMMGGDEDPGGNEAGGSTPSADQNTEPSAPASKPAKDEAELPKIDAKTLRLEGGTTVDTQFDGAEAGGGVYVTGFNKVGAKVVWAVKDIEKAGTYRLDVRFGIPGVDADATVVVNGKPNTSPLNMENFIGEKRAPKGDWEKGWQTTWAPVNLTKGSNVIEIACAEGNQCDAVLDQLSLSRG